jgi:hypothetical protein
MSVFKEKAHLPDEAELATVLGRSYGCWTELKTLLPGPVTEKWSYPGKKYGWSLALQRSKRTILYLIPERRYFRVGFALGGKAVVAARASELPAPVIETIENAPQYAEGCGVHLDVRFKKDLPPVMMLSEIKMEN